MAQAQLLPMALPGIGMAGHKTAQDLHEIQECEKLVRLRDQVLSGTHPRIKPTHLTAKPSTEERTSNEFAFAANYSMSPIAPTHDGVNGTAAKSENVQAEVQKNFPSQVLPGLGAPSSTLKGAGSASRPYMPSGNAEFNPVLLEKSDDLKKAEMRLQRQRIERSFQDELDKRRVGAKASLQSAELPVDVDLSDVLSKALTIVQPTTGQATDDTAANGSASGDDSFDDNTFYSSQHDTPEFLEKESREPNKSKSPEDVQMLDESDYEPELDSEPVSLVTAAQPTAFNIANHLQVANGISQEKKIPTGPASQLLPSFHIRPSSSTVPPKIPGLQTVQTSQQTLEVISSQDSGAEASNSEEASSLDRGQHPSQSGPIMRGHNLSPIAPQPSRVSPLAVARQPAALQNDHSGRRATPPQVAALRKQGSGASSPDSSPQTGRSSEKRKSNKKKNKLAAKKGKGKEVERPASPVIKDEPRSPSPMVAPEFARPAKRQRQGRRAGDHGEARFEQPNRADLSQGGRYEQPGRVEERQVLREPPQLAGEPASYREQPARNQVRHEADYYEPRRPAAVQYARPASPGAMYPVHRVIVDSEGRTVREVSRAVVERPYYEQYYGSRDGGSMSVRPAAMVDRDRSRSPAGYDRPMSAMPPPPRAPLRRIIVDEYGREVVEPPRPIAIRRPSMMPGYHLDDAEVIYERAVPARAISRRPEAYETDDLTYGQPPAAYAPCARRVFTQPELAGPDYRAYGEREYNPRAPIQRPAEELGSSVQAGFEVPREYGARAASVRPGAEPLRYEAPGGAYERAVVDEPLREYGRAASVRPLDPPRYEVRQSYEYVQVPTRPGTVRPMEAAHYGAPRDAATGWTRMESVRPEQREYEPRSELPREMAPPAPPAGRAYSVRPVETGPAAGVRQEYRRPLQPAGGYYDQRPPARANDEIMYVGQTPRQDGYHQRGQ